MLHRVRQQSVIVSCASPYPPSCGTLMITSHSGGKNFPKPSWHVCRCSPIHIRKFHYHNIQRWHKISVASQPTLKYSYNTLHCTERLNKSTVLGARRCCQTAKCWTKYPLIPGKN